MLYIPKSRSLVIWHHKPYWFSCNVYGNQYVERLVWEFELLLFHGIEMMLVYKLTVCVFGSRTKINPFITTYCKNRQFWITFITMSGMPYPYYDLWNNKADLLISSFIKDWALLVYWWQQQSAVEDSSRGGERARDTLTAKPCAQLSGAVRHFEVELRQHWYGGSYKDKCFFFCEYKAGRIFRRHIVEHTDSPRCRQGTVCSRWRGILHYKH